MSGAADDTGPPQVDHVQAQALLGAHVLVGLTYRDADGEVEAQRQFHGIVTVVSDELIDIQPTSEDELFTLPPDLRPFQPAPPGEYRLRSTGEVVVDPDFTCSWTITRPAS